MFFLIFHRRDPSPIKDPTLSLLNEEDPEKDEDDDFWMKTCDSFVVQLAETEEKKNIKSPVKRKSPKDQQSLPPKRKYTKRIKVEPISEDEQNNKPLDLNEETLKSVDEIKLEKSPLQENTVCDDKPIKSIELLNTDKENKTKLEDREQTSDGVKEKDDGEELKKVKPKKNVLKLKFQKPLITKMKKINKENKKQMKMKELKKESKKDEKKEVKKGDKKDVVKKELLLQQKLEKKELAAAVKEEKKGLKKEEKRDLKKEHQLPENNTKKDLSNCSKKEGKKVAARKKVVAEKENLTKNIENMTRRLAAETAAGKFNPRQSLRRKNSLKDYSFAFDELLDDAFVHFEVDKIPLKRKRKCASPPPPVLSPPSPPVLTAAPVVCKKNKKETKDNETIRMRLRSRNRPLLTKQESKQAAAKKNKLKNGKAKNNVISKPGRRRKKSLGEKSAHPDASAADDDWKDEVYKFKRSLRLPSKLISVVSPPGAARPDQVSLTSIMNMPPSLKPEKDIVKSAPSLQIGVAGKSCKAKQRLQIGAHLMYGRRDVFKGRRLLKREKIVSAEKLMRRKRRQLGDEEKKDEFGAAAAAAADETDVAPPILDDQRALAAEANDDPPPPKRVYFKRKFMRKKFRSGFDYIKKKKKKEPVSSEKRPTAATATTAAAAAASSSVPLQTNFAPRYVSEIQAEIKGWLVNKGHGETVLHRAAKLGAEVSRIVFLSFGIQILIRCRISVSSALVVTGIKCSNK